MDRVRRSYRRKTDTLESVYDWSQQLIEAADRKVTNLLLTDRVIISFSATWNLRKCCTHVKLVMMLSIVLAGTLQEITSIST
jgi:type II secretory pathway component PulJ